MIYFHFLLFKKKDSNIYYYFVFNLSVIIIYKLLTDKIRKSEFRGTKLLNQHPGASDYERIISSLNEMAD